jgi:hypothetical protein
LAKNAYETFPDIQPAARHFERSIELFMFYRCSGQFQPSSDHKYNRDFEKVNNFLRYD